MAAQELPVAQNPLEIMMLITKGIRLNPELSPAEKQMETFPLLPQDQQQPLLRLLLRQQPLLPQDQQQPLLRARL